MRSFVIICLSFLFVFSAFAQRKKHWEEKHYINHAIDRSDDTSYEKLIDVKKTKSGKHQTEIFFKKVKKNDDGSKKKVVKKKKYKNGKLVKKVKRVVYIDSEGNKSFGGPVSISEIENSDSNLLTLEFDSKDIQHGETEKFTPFKARYKVFTPEENFEGRSGKIDADLYSENGKERFDVDISELLPGDYELFVRVVSHKTKHLDKNKKKPLPKFVHIASVEFTKEMTDTATAVVEKIVGGSFSYSAIIEVGNSYSNGGEIVSANVNLFLGEELINSTEKLTSEGTSFGYNFTTAGTYRIVVVVTDSLGDTDTVELEHTVERPSPVLKYNYTQNPEFRDIISIDLSESFVSDGTSIQFYGVVFYKDGAIFDTKFTNKAKFDYQIPTRGNFALFLVAGYGNPSVQNFEMIPLNFLDESVPKSLLLNFIYEFTDENNPKNLFLGFNNQITEQEFKQFNITLKNVETGVETQTIDSNYKFYDGYLQALLSVADQGTYEARVELELQDGQKSTVLEITREFEFDLGVATFDFDLELISGREYSFVPKNVSPGNFGYFETDVCHYSHPESSTEFDTYGNLEAQNVTLDAAGTWNIECHLTTNTNLEVTTTKTQIIENSLPIINFDIVLTDLYNGRFYEFKSGATVDLDGYIVLKQIKIEGPSGVIVDAETGDDYGIGFDLAGVYTVTITATDQEGGISSLTKTFEIVNKIPTANIEVTLLDEAQRLYKINLTNSDEDGYIIEGIFSGTSPTGETYSFAAGGEFESSFSEVGTHIIEYRVKDNDGAYSETYRTEVNIINQLPVMSMNIVASEESSRTYEIQSGASFDPDGELVSKKVKITGPDNFLIDQEVGDSFNFSTEKAGTYQVELTGIDQDGGSSLISETINIINAKPTASLEVAVIDLDARLYKISVASNDSDGLIERSELLLTNPAGEISNLAIENELDLNFVEPGVYLMSYQVFDNDDEASTIASASIEVINKKPQLLVNLVKNSNFNYSIEAIGSDEDGEVLETHLKLSSGAGTVLEYTSSNLDITFPQEGEWQLEAYVVDNDGASSEIYQTEISVINLLPVIDFDIILTDLYNGRFYNIETGRSSDPDGDIVLKHILIVGPEGILIDSDMGDDYGLGLDVPGSYSITISATDQDGGLASLTKTVEVINKVPVVDFDIILTDLYNGRFYNIETGRSSDPDGDIVLKHILIVGAQGVFLDSDMGDDYGVGFDDAGSYSVTITATDQDGGSSSLTKTIEIINKAPVASLAVELLDANQRLYQITLDATDEDGYIIEGTFYATSPTGETVSFGAGGVFEYDFLEVGTHILDYIVRDNDGELSESVQTEINIINSLPVMNMNIIASDEQSRFFEIQTGESYDLDGEIVSKSVKITGPDSFLIDEEVGDSYFFNATLAGEYLVELTGVDNDGGESTTSTILAVINKVPIIDVTVQQLSSSEYEVSTEASDIDGEISSIFYELTSPSGVLVHSSGFDAKTFTILEKGEWSLVVFAQDNEGTKSEKFTTNFTGLGEIPVADLKLESQSSSSYIFNASGSSDIDGEIVSYTFNLTSSNGENAQITQQGATLSYSFDSDASWEVSLLVEDDSGNFSTNEAIVRILVNVIPPDPGPPGKVGVLGIDSDGDGVRDDVERTIASLVVSDEKKIQLNEYARNLQAGLNSANIEDDSIRDSYQIIDQSYCMLAFMTPDEVSDFSKAIKIVQYNTKERLIEYFKTRSNFAGQVITSDLNGENYTDYCK